MSHTSPSRLSDVDDDTLIAIFSFLPVSSILAMRQTCSRMKLFSYARVIWHNAYLHEVLYAGYPFPHDRVMSMDASELEDSVRRAHRIGQFWRSPDGARRPKKFVDFEASDKTEVNIVRFIPGHLGTRVITVTRGIWSMVTLWEIVPKSTPPYVRKIAEWYPKGMAFTGVVVNSVADPEGGIIATLNDGSRYCMKVLSTCETEDGQTTLQPVRTIVLPFPDATPFRPITLEGDLIACSDESANIIILNWRSGACAFLRSSQEHVDHYNQGRHAQYSRCSQVVFAHNSILVVRARSIELYSMPLLRLPSDSPWTYHPIAQHSFGWIDGVSVSTHAHDSESSAIEPLSILLRTESDDLWSSNAHRLDLYILEPNPLYVDDARLAPSETPQDADPAWHPESVPAHSPYLFPPVHSTQSFESVRGILRYTDMVLGPCGTAVWIQSRPPNAPGLAPRAINASGAPRAGTYRSKETLVAAVFAGTLQREHAGMDLGARSLWTQPFEKSFWTSMDYDEEMGRIVLGTSQGMVTMLDLR